MVYERADENIIESIYRKLPLHFFDWISGKRNQGWELFHPFTSRHYETLENKPVVDCAKPTSWINEKDQMRRMAACHGNYIHYSLAHFQNPLGDWEPVEGTSTYSDWDLYKFGFFIFSVTCWTNYVFRNIASQTNVFNPRTKWAHNLTIAVSLIRINLCCLIGWVGYLELYRAIYTYGPCPDHFLAIGIRDPSNKGWYENWKDGQDSSVARIFAGAICTPLAYAFWRGGWKKSGAWSFNAGLFLFYYEYCRYISFPGNRAMSSVVGHEWNMREARYGSLKPDLKRHLDHTTNKPLSATQSEYIKSSQGQLRMNAMENLTPDNFPVALGGTFLPNPYYNPQKRPQYYDAKPAVFKNDYFKLPHPVGARMLSHAADQPVVAPLR